MQAAVSQPVDYPVGTVARGMQAKTNATRNGTPIELVRDIPTAEYADLPAVEHHADVVPRERSEVLGRAVNVVVAVVALVILFPILALVAIAVRLTSRGPVFYSQTRVGLDRRFGRGDTDGRRVYDHGGKLFEMYKFRTMRTDAEIDGRAVWAQKRDPRVTAIGRFLRCTRR